MTELPRKIAYCAPGRESLTAFLLAYHDVDFDEVRASAMMEGRTDAILIDNGAIKDTFTVTSEAFAELTRSLNRSSESLRTYMRNYATAPVLTGNSFRMLSGA